MRLRGDNEGPSTSVKRVHLPRQVAQDTRNPTKPKDKKLRILNINARSIVNKKDSIEATLLEYDPHITVITETWLRNEISDDLVFPPSYSVFRKDRTANKGGGVAILVKPSIQAIVLADVADLECLCIKITCWGQCFVLYACYRPPDAAPEYLLKLQEHMTQFQSKKIFVIGDFNLPNVDWELLRASRKSNKNANIVFDIMLTHDLVQVVRQPTREERSSSAILDLAFLNRDFCEYTVLIESGLSDHHLVSVTIPLFNSVGHKRTTTRSFKDYARSDDASIVQYMRSCYDDFIENEDDVDALWNKFTEMCHHCIRSFVTTKSKKIAKNTPWITCKIIHLKAN